MNRKDGIRSATVTSMKQSERAASEFTVDHVYDIRSAVVCLLDVVASVVAMKSGNVPDSFYNMTQQVYALDEKHFKGIHDRYLWWSSSFSEDRNVPRSAQLNSAKPNLRTTSQHGFAIKYSRVEADRFLKSLLIAFDACKDALLQSLKRRSNKETSLYHQLISLKGDLAKQEEEAKLAQIKLDDARREKEAWLAQIDQLKQDLKSAEMKIARLERLSSVMTWQHDLDDITNKHILEIDELKSSLESERSEHRLTCERLTTKITKLESEVKRLKLRSTLPIASVPNCALHEKLDHTKQQLFLREQEIHNLGREVSNQQRLMAGYLHGLQQDFKFILDKLEHDNPSKVFSPEAENIKFQAMLRVLHEACLSGKFRELEGSLPQQYAPSNAECISPLKKKNSWFLSEKSSLDENNILKNKKLNLPKSKLRSSSLQGRFQPLKDTVRPSSARNLMTKPFTISPSNEGKTASSRQASHPRLVNPATGRANLMEVMRHFPYLSVEQVSEQWENFRKYDKNNDFSLDLPELYEVIQDVCGLNVSVSEMREAMLEVDRDKSNNIDFYEYLKIAEMIIRKQGNAAIFQTDMLQERGVTSSKACIIQ